MKHSILLPLFSFALSLASAVADDLGVLSDEFDDPATLGNWLRLDDVEGWNADKLELHDVDGTAPGQMRIMPYTTSWYMDLTGPLVFKEVTGDFAVTLHLDVRRRNGQPGRPVGTFSLGGIMIRTPRPVANANPQPDPGPAVQLPWPPPPGTSTDWTPDSENYIFLSYGNTDGSAAPDQWNYEVKTTIDGHSTLYYDDQGVPAGASVVTLQAVRVGSTFVVMRKHPGGEWILENRYHRPDMPATLQVGITTYTDWGNIIANGMFTGNDQHSGPFHHNHNVMTAANGFTADPDLVVDAEYFRYARPPEDLTEAQLDALPLTSDGGGIQLLSATPLAGVLGDAIDQPYVPPGPGELAAPENAMATGGIFEVTVTWTPVSGAAEHAILRNISAGVDGSIEVGRVADPTGSYQDDSAEAGQAYYYAVRGIAPDGTEGELSAWIPGSLAGGGPEFRPDGQIGRRAGAKIGDGIFNGSGAGQRLRVKSRVRKKLRFFVRLENDGTATDTLEVGRLAKNRNFRIKVIERLAAGGVANRTGALRAGTFAPELAADEGVELIGKVKRRGPKTGRKKRWTLRIPVISANDPEERDTVKARFESP